METPQTEPKLIKPIRKYSSLADMASEAIREAIVTGRIKPGERMGQVELAKELGVSGRTVREAFAQLVAKGLAVHEPFKGVRVSALPVEELHEVYIMRALLEGHAMELAASHINSDQIEQMHSLLPATVANNTHASLKTAQETNREFHWIPIHVSGSRILANILEQLWEMMFAYDLLYQNPGEVDATRKNDLTQHEQLIKALETGDGKRAALITKEHVESTIESLLARLADHPIAPAPSAKTLTNSE